MRVVIEWWYATDGPSRLWRCVMQTIDVTPTWEAAVRIFVAVLQNPDAEFSAREGAMEELLRLARIVDGLIEEQSQGA